MKYLIGYGDDFEKKLDKIAKDLIDADVNEVAEILCEVFGFDENTNIEELSVLDIIPGLVELTFGIPAEILTKPMVQLTEEDGEICEEAFDRVMTIFTSNKA